MGEDWRGTRSCRVHGWGIPLVWKMDIEESSYGLHWSGVLSMVKEIALAGCILGLPAEYVEL